MLARDIPALPLELEELGFRFHQVRSLDVEAAYDVDRYALTTRFLES